MAQLQYADCTSKRPVRRSRRVLVWVIFITILCSSLYISYLSLLLLPRIFVLPAALFNKPLLDLSDFSNLADHCAAIPPIPLSDFVSRQRSLVKRLRETNAGAYIAEPGSNGLYFANISSAQWHLSERPFLIIITPAERPVTEASFTILAPRFEIERAKLLGIPIIRGEGLGSQSIAFIEWAEDEDPFNVLFKALPDSVTNGTVVLDQGMRKFIADGLVGAGLTVKSGGYPPRIAQIREQKSAAEIELLKCANEATVLAVREVKRRLRIGMTESATRKILEQAMTAVGLTNGGGLVLFGENAALPHGSGTDKRLEYGDFILMDVGGSLHGYVSDVTRTFTISPPGSIDPRHLELWYVVLAAQKAALKAAQRGVYARNVDKIAREVVKTGLEDYGVKMQERWRFLGTNDQSQENFDVNDYFTHRLGHGIGLEGHESPYLVGGQSNRAVLATNNTFSNEPGVYILNKVGIRLEDCFYVPENGPGVLLTEGVGGLSASPWEP
ncbi:Creatinase/aminopeptidase [Clavulina sp. PMI_390]|nr:Creatinase/aminopeptidase [Clavulina sp. PMI_390]